MLIRINRLPLLITVTAVVLYGCSGGSGSSNPASPDGGDNGGWNTQAVKTGNFANGEINLAIDAEGNLHISAYDFNTGLQYCTDKSGSWASTLVAVDSGDSDGVLNDITVDDEGKIHIVYSNYYGIRYVTNESGAWVDQDMWLQGGGSCCIIADSGGDLHTAFDDGSLSDIRYAHKPSGGVWDASIALADEWINSSCDIDLDGSDAPHVIFNFSGHHNLRYAWLDASWHVSTLEGTDSYPYVPDTGWTPSIAVNKVTGAVNIVFWNSTYDAVQFSDGTANNAVTLKSDTGWARPVITLDGNGFAHVFFGEYGSRNMNYSTNASGTWVNTVLSMENNGDELAVGIDGSGMIHLIYANYSELDLRHASLQL